MFTCLVTDELGELSQWLCHDDSTINIVVVIVIIIIICYASTRLDWHEANVFYLFVCFFPSVHLLPNV